MKQRHHANPYQNGSNRADKIRSEQSTIMIVSQIGVHYEVFQLRVASQVLTLEMAGWAAASEASPPPTSAAAGPATEPSGIKPASVSFTSEATRTSPGKRRKSNSTAPLLY
jgi:hypothetical protein